MTVLLVDAANVVGARPDGWWRDRPAAAARLVRALRAADLPYDVVVVLEGVARAGVPESAATPGAVRVVHAAGSGDDALAALAGPDTVLVSADRALGARVRALGGQVVGPGWLYAQTEDRPA